MAFYDARAGFTAEEYSSLKLFREHLANSAMKAFEKRNRKRDGAKWDGELGVSKMQFLLDQINEAWPWLFI